MKTGAAWNKLKNLLVAVVITVLIWLVADRYVLETRVFKIPVRVVSADTDRYASIADPPHQITVSVTMAGRRRHLKAFSDLLDDLANTRGCLEIAIDETVASSPEPRTLSGLDDRLRKIKTVAESRLSIESVAPNGVDVLIDNYVDIQNVAVVPDFGELEVSAPSCSPDTVSVRMPRYARQRLLRELVIRPKVETIVRDATGAKADFQIPLTLTLDADPELAAAITIEPDRVTLAGVVEARIDTARKGPVQITYSIPPEVQLRFEVRADPGTLFRQSIDITGPKNRLEQLDPRDIRAFVDVKASDAAEADAMPDREFTRSVRYVLPPGFTLAPEFRPHEIVFRLIRRPTDEMPDE